MYYPIMMQGKQINALVVGGGKVGYRKCKTLLEAGAQVTVIAPTLNKEFLTLINQYPEQLTVQWSKFHPKFLNRPYHLVFAATNSKEVQTRIHLHCRAKGLLCNDTANGKKSDFINCLYTETEEVVLAFSTKGNGPKILQEMKEDFQDRYEKQWAKRVREYGEERRSRLRRGEQACT
ncbi:MAG TPA: hypothetical protein DHN33_10675 [Eubacteriaceae bacterium]|nr:hypothetical protein [Eubacteriaceae bacterium]